ncbi:unnamed protein product [Notodromas monacha]|uniref:NADP-dependent oxidoreductase domain-containing protein n=1 Tax=Notodromas monacha TaxID=399045 RepID=A0A7R9BSR9_9CRUS|nr:unnamed protein product [Notodromas monacha]CAG0919983.1 unnamed protein product [Notodromas monacha]
MEEEQRQAAAAAAAAAGAGPSSAATRPQLGIELENLNANNLTPAVISVQSSASLSRQSSSLTPGLRYRNLGKSGLKVSNLGLATWVVCGPHTSDALAEEIITLAYESGINLFDLSEVYSCGRAESTVGRILQKKKWNRSSFNVITKVHWGKGVDSNLRSLSRKTIIESIKASLQRLQLEYIDIVIIHKADPMCPMEEVVRAMSYCINKGWVMYWGSSRWSPVEIFEAYTNARQFNCPVSIVEQTEYHFHCRDKTELYLPEMYNQIGVGCMTWSPLGVGLVGKYDDGKPLFSRPSFKKKYSSLGHPEDQSKDHSEGKGGAACSSSAYSMSMQVDSRLTMEEFQTQRDQQAALVDVADRIGCSVSHLSLAWCLKNEDVQCVLVGAPTPDQFLDQLCCLQILPRMTPGLMMEIEQILENKPVRPAMISTLHKQR